jgi:hypothetical protein
VVDGYYSSSSMSFEWLRIFSLIWEATVVENKLATKESLLGHLPYGVGHSSLVPPCLGEEAMTTFIRESITLPPVRAFGR